MNFDGFCLSMCFQLQTIWHCYTPKLTQHEQTPYLNLLSERPVCKCTIYISIIHSNLVCHHTHRRKSISSIHVIIIVIIIISKKQHQNIVKNKKTTHFSPKWVVQSPALVSWKVVSPMIHWGKRLSAGAELPPTVESCNSAGTEAGECDEMDAKRCPQWIQKRGHFRWDPYNGLL